MATLIGEMLGESFSVDPAGGDSVRRFIVRAASQVESKILIIAAAGISSNAPHPSNPSIYADKFGAEQDDKAWWKWIVTIDYKSPDDPTNIGGEDNPLLQAPEIDYNTEEYFYTAIGVVDTDTNILNGEIANSAGESYDPQPPEEIPILVINIQRNEPHDISVTKFYEFSGSVNSDTFFIGDLTIAPGFAKVRISASPTIKYVEATTQDVTLYRTVQYSIKLHPISWDIQLLDEGKYYIDDDGMRVAFYTDPVDGTPAEPRLGHLDGAGGELIDGEPVVFNKFENKRRRPFALLSLPSGP